MPKSKATAAHSTASSARGGSGKHDDPDTIPARGFTLSIVYVPPGQGNAAHTHEVEEVFLSCKGI
jgi:mannose-6-phosphate isomerase-like protein (cupin superfamily)